MRSAFIASVVLAGCVAGQPEELGETAAALQVCGGSLQAAIDGAPEDAVLEICAATYHERLLIDGKRIELRGVSGAAATIIDADGGGPAITVRNSGGAGVTIRGLTVTQGRSSSSGGGVACRSSTLVMRDSVVTESTGGGGGGLGADGCTLDVAGVRFDGNDAGSGRGGGALLTSSSGVITASTFAGNNAEEGGGVAVVGGTVAVTDNDLTGNSAHRGGGVFVGHDGVVSDNRIVGNEGRWTGGGLYIDARTGTLERNLVEDNTSVNDGGGIYVHQGAPALVDFTIRGNRTGDDGGGVRFFESRGRLIGSLVEGNHAADSGGGIRASHLPTLLVDNLIRDNDATLGGGLDLDNDASVVRGGAITGNHATNGGGLSAGLYPWDGAAIEHVLIADNVATGSGGGLYLVDNPHPIAMRGLVVRNNRAGKGGGLYVRATGHSIANSIFDRNVATGDGGALHVAAGTTPATYSFLTVHGNSAAGGAGLYAASAVSLSSSIVSQNDVKVTVAPAWRYNDTWPATFSGMANPTGSSGNLSGDPRFADAASGDFTLASGSAAIDAGDPALHDVNGTRADQGALGGPDGSDVPPPPPPDTTVVLEADAQVLAAQPTTNFGSATSFTADADPQAEAYLRFRVIGAGPITSAKLQLTVINATGDAPTLHAAASTWDEATITWNSRPLLGAAVANLGPVALGTVEYDVSALVTGDGVYTLALIPTSTDGFDAWTREGSVPPRLVITTGEPPLPPPAGTAVLEADTYAAAATPTTSFGAATQLLSDGDPQAEAYLRFAVSGVVAPGPARARLRLHVTDASSDGPAVYRADSAWTEATLTWNDRPARSGGALGDLGACALGDVVEYDVTAAITGDGVYTFALIPTSGSGFGVSSREGANRPELLLE